ncbi:hypothetical protein E2P73_16690 [Xanthomonas perforans]|nr:hypothetical protein [Xanthomonas perforans]NEL37975.1 hypothetical protein [Xanthomonas perforans]TVS40365.1 hypothetical protein E2P72_10860 [Xanthomonas perforans]TVS62221.1 hypothetical protein E2P73_16690 [Xanthomonas perforans]
MGAARAPAMRCNIKPRRGRPNIGYALLVCEACAVASVTIDHGVIPPPISRRQKWNFLVPFPEEVP